MLLNNNLAKYSCDTNSFRSLPDFEQQQIPHTIKEIFDDDFSKRGLMGYRRYPNEELLRFLARRYGKVEDKNTVKVLEIGCGTGANLWAVAAEGFDTYGCDFSESAIEICKQMLDWRRVSANIFVQDMTALSTRANTDLFFDCAYDIFASYCLNVADYVKVIKGLHKILKTGGRFFSYTPSKNSDAFINHEPAVLIDDSTLNGIYRESAAYYGNFYPFRFISIEQVHELFENNGFHIDYMETESHTFFNMKEKFEFLLFEAVKC